MTEELDRVAPHNLEAERAVLGAICIRADVLDAVSEIVRAEDFFRDSHRRIYGHMLALARGQVAIDGVTLVDAMSKAGDLEEAGGPRYIGALFDGVPSSLNAAHYARVVREKADLRRVIATANAMIASAYDWSYIGGPANRRRSCTSTVEPRRTMRGVLAVTKKRRNLNTCRLKQGTECGRSTTYEDSPVSVVDHG
jgi:hypothetical protein